MNVDEFYNGCWSICESLAQKLGLSPWLFFCQFAVETGWGSSFLAQHCHNLAGIKYTGSVPSSDAGGFSCYSDFALFEQDYERVLHIQGYGYPELLATAGQDPTAQMQALGRSSWDEGHYQEAGGQPGQSLIAIYDDPAVVALRNQAPAPQPSPSPAPSGRTIVPGTVVTVEQGDTLSELGKIAYGSEVLDGFPSWYPIAYWSFGMRQEDGSSLQDPDLIKVGWKLAIPTHDGFHLVQDGDTLWDIAAELLGDGQKYAELFGFNYGRHQPATPGQTLTNPNRIQVGWVIQKP